MPLASPRPKDSNTNLLNRIEEVDVSSEDGPEEEPEEEKKEMTTNASPLKSKQSS